MQLTYLTTLIILAWCIVLTVLWTALAYFWAVRRVNWQPKAKPELGQGMVLPALVLAPVMLVVSFRVFGINLLFPSAFEATASVTAFGAIAPAVVLFVASGLARCIWQTVTMQFQHWQRQPFATTMLACGATREVAVRRLVVIKSFLSAWTQCLPWLYGELIIVEAVFNAPGLGLLAWDSARQRDHLTLLSAVTGLVALYTVAVALAASASHWLGRRLESYG